jgi:hypothetical protein
VMSQRGHCESQHEGEGTGDAAGNSDVHRSFHHFRSQEFLESTSSQDGLDIGENVPGALRCARRRFLEGLKVE